jgi:tRNA dimethylallyltransferase
VTAPLAAARRPRAGRHLAIVGATATGKTALACSLAARLAGVELVSVDAMSVYRGMDIGTAKPTGAERSGVRWHLLDLVDPSEEFSVAEFQREAERTVASVEERGGQAVLVGGTGLYHRAIIDELQLPGRWPLVAAELEAAAAVPGGTESLHGRLQSLDPAAAARMTPTNRRRIVRALEVTIGSGRPFSSYGPGLGEYPATAFDLVGLRLERGELRRRLAARLDAQLAAGLLEEVRRVLAAPGGMSRTARQALGYRELISHLERRIPLEEAVAEALRRTQLFAKRQEAWFGRDPRIRWFEADRPDLTDAVVALASVHSRSRDHEIRHAIGTPAGRPTP